MVNRSDDNGSKRQRHRNMVDDYDLDQGSTTGTSKDNGWDSFRSIRACPLALHSFGWLRKFRSDAPGSSAGPVQILCVKVKR